MNHFIREDQPSSGTGTQCGEHRWVAVQGADIQEGQVMMACSREGCSATKVVRKPKLQEQRGGKKLLMEG